MSERANDETFEQLAAGYFDEVLDDAQLQQFKQLLAEDDRYVKRFAELAQLHQMIESEIAYQSQAQRFHLSKSPNDSGAANALAELASLYEDELQNPVNFTAWRDEQASKAAAQRQRVQRKRLLITSAIAAVLALAGVLAFQFIANTPAPQTLTDNTPTHNKPAESAQPIPRDQLVATLTATHNATWGRPASAGTEHPPTTGSKLQPGDALAAGQRLNLTHGFAEITTARGAIAILEAPATFELLDNDNAIRLHTGKLVGICETESSKGFLVQTPHMDIIDLGTRFGVDVSGQEATEVHVLEGEVQAHQVEPGYEARIVLTKGQALRGDQDQLTRVGFDTQRFASNQLDDPYRPRFEGLTSVWRGRVTADFRPGREVSTAMQVFLEQSNKRAGFAVSINVNTSTQWPQEEATTEPIPGLAVMDVYLLHLDTPAGEAIATRDGPFILHFDRPILGVSLTSTSLGVTDKRFGAVGTTYPEAAVQNPEAQTPSRGLDADMESGSQQAVELFNDGHSLRIRLDSTDNDLDQLRVFVEALETTD